MISRRTTLKAMVAAIMAPTIRLRDSVPDERLLLSFCDPEAWRYDFTKPFGVGSLTYASDFRAMIRCELAFRVEDGERRLPKNIVDVWSHHWKPSGKFRPLTPDDIIPTESAHITGCCPHCGDRRVSFGEYFPTDQDAADSLPDWDPDDNTMRDVSCEHCHGRAFHGPSLVRIDGVLHQSWTLRRILALPNPRVCASAAITGGSSGLYQSLLFTADGFDGISMGMEDD